MKRIFMISAVLLAVFAGSANASTEREKAELARIASELKYLKHEVLQISELRRADDTEAFNYEALVNDLEAVHSAVERHLNKPSRQPKKLKPLEVEYGNLH
jgi:RAQPRD family integrative conjugative element protein